MQGAEDCQRDGETQIAQGYDLVEAAGAGDIGLGGPEGNQENQDAGAAHRYRGARNVKKRRENNWVHVDGEVRGLYLRRVLRGQYGLKLYNEEKASPLVAG
jgi:hypothetical protein